MNSTCFRFIADGRLKRKLRPMKIYPTLCNQSFLSHPRFYTTRVFSFVLPFFWGGGGKIEIKKSLLLTDKISIKGKCRLKKVRTNIAVDKKKTNPIALATAWRRIQKQTILTAPRDRSRESPRTTKNKITSRGPMVLRFVPLSPPRDSVLYTSLPSPIYRS